MVQRVVASVDLELVDVISRRLSAAAASFTPYTHFGSADISVVFPDRGMNDFVAILGLGFEKLPRYGRSVNVNPLHPVDIKVGLGGLGQKGRCHKGDG